MTSLLTSLCFMAAAAVQNAPGESDRPVSLKRIDGEGIRLEVIASSTQPIDAAYSLEVVSGEEGRANRSVQRGNVQLEPGSTATLIRHSASNRPSGRWVATLTVTPKGAPDYREVLRSD